MNSDRIWTLLARKITGEISTEEREELEALLKENPQVHLKIQSVEESWNKNESPDDEQTAQAYERLTDRLKEEGFNILAVEDTDPRPYLSGIRPVTRKYRRLLITATVI